MRARWVLLALAWGVSSAPAGAAETWTEVKTKNFTVVSNAGESAAQKTAAEFEQMRAAYGTMWPSTQAAPGKPTVVLALKDEGTLKRWAPGYFEVKGGIEVVSSSAHGADRNFLLLRLDSRPAHKDVTANYNLYRSYLTLLLSTTFERRLPLWLSNGFAGVFANTTVHESEIKAGLPVPWEFHGFSGNARLPLRAILDARRDSPLVRKEDQRRHFDAQCYVLVHYLLFGNRGARSPQLTRFQELWLSGRSHEQALEAFGDLGALERELPNYAKTPILRYATFKTEATTESVRPPARILSPAELLALQAMVHVAMNRPVEAQAAIQQARLAEPKLAASYDAEGLLADHDQDKPRATEAYAQAALLGSVSAYSHYRAAQLAWKADADASTLALRRRQLERSLELNGSYANAHSYLADVLVGQGEATPALAHAQKAVQLQPGESYHRLALARVLLKLGRIDEARQAGQRGQELADGESERENAERFILFLAESTRYSEDQARRDGSEKDASACQAGDRAACGRILPDLESACTQNRAGACQYLAWLHSGSGGLEKDAAKASAYLQRACAAGDKRVCVEHAWAQAQGEGMAKDEAKAMVSLDALCTEGFLPACTRLAFIHLTKPSARDQARAKALVKRSCDGGDQDACGVAKQLK